MKIKFPVPLDQIEIHIEAGPCFGECPMFDLVIRGTGEVDFENRSWHLPREKRSFTIETDQVKDLIAAAFEIGFFEMQRNFESETRYTLQSDGMLIRDNFYMTDHQLRKFSIKLGDKTKRVDAYLGYPQRLEWFYKLVLRVTGLDICLGVDA